MNTENGTTGIPVAPVQESEMTAIQNAFKRAADIITDHSQLARDVASLRSEFDSLKRDMEYLRSRNKELDEMLATTRQQRDEAQNQLSQTRHDLAEANAKVEGLTSRAESAEHTIESLRQELEATRKDRDEFASEWHKSDDQLKEVQNKLSEIEDFAQRAFNLTKPPQPANVPQAEPAPQGSGQSWDQPMNHPEGQYNR